MNSPLSGDRFHAALYAQQPGKTATMFPTNDDLIKIARLAGAAGGVPDCINSGKYFDRVGAAGISGTPTVRINGEDFQFSTPDALVARIKEIVGDVPG